MSKLKNEEYTNISIEEATQKLQENRDQILEEFAKAYLAETKLLPSEVELVCHQEMNGAIIENVYFFRRKQ